MRRGIIIGYGDELLASGEASRLHEQTGQHVFIGGLHSSKRPHWSEVWDNIDYIRRAPGENIITLINCPGSRPYIASKTERKWTWKPYKPIPAEIVFTPAELRFAERFRGAMLLEPNIKPTASPNKKWPWTRWMEVAKRLGGRVIQVGNADTRTLPGVELVRTSNFRLAAAVLSVCRGCIVHEGGLHHAAAALGIQATVIRGGFISPEVTGYTGQVNLFGEAWLGCGMRVPCEHCKAAMDKISVEDVLETI